MSPIKICIRHSEFMTVQIFKNELEGILIGWGIPRSYTS